jgi:biotin transporter BioY
MATYFVRRMMKGESTHFLRLAKSCAIALCGLMVTGIVTLMFLARGTGEDITGIVAPALLVTFVSGVVAIVASIFQKRELRQ